mgnify:CR=1 FL=1
MTIRRPNNQLMLKRQKRPIDTERRKHVEQVTMRGLTLTEAQKLAYDAFLARAAIQQERERLEEEEMRLLHEQQRRVESEVESETGSETGSEAGNEAGNEAENDE